MPAILETCRISVRFGGLAANDNINMQVQEGEILGLIGPNGAGKSTLFNIIAGIVRPDSGSVIFGGTDITGYPAPKRCIAGIARTFQVVRSFENMSVLDNVLVGALVRQPATQLARRRACEVLELVGLEQRRSARANELTLSEKRRLELARAIATDPKLLLLDEVMTGLTPTEARSGAALIKQVRDLGISIIMVEHVMEVLMPLVDRVIVLDLGSVIADGLPADIAASQAVITAYLGGPACA